MTDPRPLLTELPQEAFEVWRKPERAISPVAIVATIDPDGTARTAPFGSLRAITPRLLRFATARYNDTYQNLCRDARVTVALLATPNIALAARGRARVVKESMASSPEAAIVEIDIDQVKNDMVGTLRIESGVTAVSRQGLGWWFHSAIGEIEQSD